MATPLPALLPRRCLCQSQSNNAHSLLFPRVREFTSSSARPARADDQAAEKGPDDATGGRVRFTKAPTRHRRRMYMWLNGPGKVFREATPGLPNYLGAYNRDGRLLRGRDDGKKDGEGQEAKEDEGEDESVRTKDGDVGDEESGSKKAGGGTPLSSDYKVFPLNDSFVSQTVLSEPLREAIWKMVVVQRQSISEVSATMKVDMRRVAAVVRLKEVEKKWVKERRPLATEYASAVLEMVPQTPLAQQISNQTQHESINDLPVHPYTTQQIFWPTSESRQFTREDAATVFHPDLLTAEKRIPHPELVQDVTDADVQDFIERHSLGTDAKTRQNVRNKIKTERATKVREAAAKLSAQKSSEQAQRDAARVKVVSSKRVDFRFEAISADAVGKDGRDPRGVGWRYGMPHEDRKRGHVKGVPTTVDV